MNQAWNEWQNKMKLTYSVILFGFFTMNVFRGNTYWTLVSLTTHFLLLCKLHLAHFKCRKKVCTPVVTLSQCQSCVHYIQYVILLGAVSKVACVFWPKCFWKCDVKRETYKSISKLNLVNEWVANSWPFLENTKNTSMGSICNCKCVF